MRKVLSLFVDYTLLVLSTIIAFELSPSFVEEVFVGNWLNPHIQLSVIFLPLAMLVGIRVIALGWGLDRKNLLEKQIRILAGLLVGILVFQLITALTTATLTSRFVHLIALAYGNSFLMGARICYSRLAPKYTSRVVVFGSANCFAEISRIISKSSNLEYVAVGFVSETDSGDNPQNIRYINRKGQMLHYCRDNKIDMILVDTAQMINVGDTKTLMLCTASGIRVMDIASFYERNFNRVYEKSVDERWFWGYDPAYLHPYFTAFKRGVDVTVSVFGLLTVAIFAPFVALAIKLQDGGPIFYSQIRTGLLNKPFHIYKFRTMRIDAEKAGAQWAKEKDHRVTWLGKLLRKTRFDEVPQFWNILKGDMSFVGPRPERPEMIATIEKSIPFYRYRHLIKPGLTGWAQINYPYGASIEDTRNKLSYDFYYLKYSSITLDLIIIARTLVAMARGAR
jgi:exopolysaccharide biosynthesis polyprenyl glycosylphosphotransferase